MDREEHQVSVNLADTVPHRTTDVGAHELQDFKMTNPKRKHTRNHGHEDKAKDDPR